MNRPASDPNELRRIAEMRLKERPASGELQSEAELRRMHHELQVHQIELELQNEDLCEKKAELEVLLKRYSDHFDAAPVSYFNLTADGTIADVNLAGSTLVGIDRARLRGSRFGELLSKTDRESFAKLLADVFATGVKQSTDLTIVLSAGTTTYVSMEASLSTDGEECRVVLFDLTAQKLTGNKLRLSDLALNGISQGVVITDVDQRIQWVNEAFESITGYSRSEILGQTWHFLQNESIDPETLAAIRNAVKNGTDINCEILNCRKNGSEFWNELTISPIRNQQGELTHIIGVARDITPRMQSEKDKQRSEERLKFAMKASNVGLWDWNLLTNEVEYSREWKSQLGYGDYEIPNNFFEWESRVQPNDLLLANERRQSYLEGNSATYDVEFRMRHKDGSWRWINARGEVLRDKHGNHIGMLGCHIDITEQKRLIESSELMRFCIDHSGESIFWTDRVGRLIYANKTACEERGYSLEEMLTMTVFDLDVEREYQPDRWENHFEDLKRVGSIRLETRHRKRNGDVFPVEVVANYVCSNDHEFNFATVRDITERRQKDENLRQASERLKLLSQELIRTREVELQKLAGALHDEIGQMLTAMKLNLRAIQASKGSIQHFHLDEVISLIDQTTEQVRNLAINIRPPQLEHLGLVAALVWYLSNQSKQIGFKWNMVLASEEIQISKELATTCFRIVQEAVTNAVRHATPKVITVELRQDDVQFDLFIRDDGKGFDVDAALNNAITGKSFGLANMQERAALMNGYIEFSSVPSQGSVVHALFPFSAVT